MAKPAWTWAEYHRGVARDKRAAARRAAKAELTVKGPSAAQPPQGHAPAPPPPTLCTDVAPAPFVPRQRIDISAAPSGMEAQAERWKGKGPAPMALAAVPELCAGEVMCRCGSRASGKGRGPVPYWFGEKCIEANCELRGNA